MQPEINTVYRVKTVLLNNKEVTMSERKTVNHIFSSLITSRRFIPGRDGYDEDAEHERERREFEAIDDYIEQA